MKNNEPMVFEKNQKKVLNAWCMYDWANSVFPLTITSAIFPIYWNSQTKNGVEIMGFNFEGSVLFSYCLSLAFLIIAFLNPILSGIADHSGNKKLFMKLFVLLGAISCFAMYFFDTQSIWLGVFAFIFGTVGYAGSIVFYNAYLPEIATEDQFDLLSAKGFSMGYIGGVVLLILNLVLIMFPSVIYDVDGKIMEIVNLNQQVTKEQATLMAKSYFEKKASQLSFVTVGVWWMLFSLIPFHYLPSSKIGLKKLSLKKGYHELQKVYSDVKKFKLMKQYLVAFFFYSMGVQTVMYVASMFGVKELNLPKENLIITILLIQLIAIGGAYLFSFLSQKMGNIKSLMVSVIIWIGICIGAFYVNGVNGFYLLASVVGLVMGGIQSLSRSTFAKLIPNDTRDNASYFSFYELTEKIAIVIGTFSFGFIEQIIHVVFKVESMRYSVLSLMLFFIIGLVLLINIRNENVEV